MTVQDVMMCKHMLMFIDALLNPVVTAALRRCIVASFTRPQSPPKSSLSYSISVCQAIPERPMRSPHLISLGERRSAVLPSSAHFLLPLELPLLPLLP